MGRIVGWKIRIFYHKRKRILEKLVDKIDSFKDKNNIG